MQLTNEQANEVSTASRMDWCLWVDPMSSYSKFVMLLNLPNLPSQEKPLSTGRVCLAPAWAHSQVVTQSSQNEDKNPENSLHVPERSSLQN